MLPIRGRPIIERTCEQLAACFEQILISANEADKFAFLGFDVVPDKVPQQGPLMGIASALEASANEINFVAACDIPKINLAIVKKMLIEAVDTQADIVVPIVGEKKYEPLFAIYRKTALKAINKVLSSGRHKISEIFPFCNVKYFELDETELPININTMVDYEEFRKTQDDKIR